MLALNKKDANIDELIELFSLDPNVARSFTKEVMLKYINTLKLANVEITKYNAANNNKYAIVRSPLEYDFSPDILKALAAFEVFTDTLSHDILKSNVTKIISKIVRIMSDNSLDIYRKEKSAFEKNNLFSDKKFIEYQELIKKFQKLCMDGKQLLLTYKLPGEVSPQVFTLEPTYVKYDVNNAYLCGYNVYAKQKQMFKVDYVEEIRQLPHKSFNKSNMPSAVFKLTGRLAKGYKLRDNEKIIQEDLRVSSITVSSAYDDKFMLFKRLLRYGSNCQIVYPNDLRKEFFDYINKTLSNYM